MLIQSTIILSLICVANLITVGYVEGPCECSNNGDIQCRFLSNIRQLQSMMNNAREKISMSTFGPAVVNSIHIYDSNFESVPPDIFRYTGAKYLYIHNSPILKFVDRETGRAFIGLEPSVEQIKINGSEFEVSRWTDMSNLKSLTSLSITRLKLGSITNLLFERPPKNLSMLYLYSNDIESLADRVFSHLDQLTDLNLAKNRINTITRSMFSIPAMKLKSIFLNDNNIKHLTADIFSQMPKLTEVSFRNNKLTQLGAETWNLVWNQLDTIFLSGNEWSCRCSTMGWLLKLQHPSYQYVTGHCASPQTTAGVELGQVTNLTLACDLENVELS